MGEDVELAVGMIVHTREIVPGECRAAMIVRVWNQEHKMVNLQGFPDGSNDNIATSTWLTSRAWYPVVHPANPGQERAAWHWPYECESAAEAYRDDASG